MSTDTEDRDAWVKELAMVYAEKVNERDPAFDAGYSDEEGRATWRALAEIAASWAERLAQAERYACYDAAKQTPQQTRLMNAPIPWREAIKPE